MCNPNDISDDEDGAVSVSFDDGRDDETTKIKKLVSKQSTNAAILRTLIIFVVCVCVLPTGVAFI